VTRLRAYLEMCKRYLTLPFILILLYYLCIYLLSDVIEENRISAITFGRQQRLQIWQSQVHKFLKEKKRLPRDLYELSITNPDDFYLPYTSLEAYPLGELEELLSDPNRFKEKVEYRIVGNEKKWFIEEVRTSYEKPPLMCIDMEGNIYTAK